MSNLSDLLPAGAGAKVATFTADGTLPTGQAVALQSDGTVKVISSSSESESLGSAVQIEGGTNTYGPMAAFDSTNNKVVVVYRADSGGHLKAVAGTVSGSSITFGTALEITTEIDRFTIAYNVNQDAFLVMFRNKDQSNFLYGVGLTITSGTTLSEGTVTSINSSNHRFGELAYNSTRYDMFVVYSDANADLDYRVVTMTGTSLSVDSANEINGSNNHYNGAAVAYCPHQERMLVVFCDDSDGQNGEYRMYSASGSTNYTSAASGTYESSTNAINPDIVHIGNSQFVIGHRNDDSYPNWDGEFYVATITSSTVTIGTKLQYENMQTLGLTYDSNADKVVVQFDKINDSNKGYYGVGTVSGTGASATISFDTAVVFHSDGSIEADYVRMGPTFDSNSNRVIIVYRNRTDTEGNVHVLTLASSSTNSGDYIGITNQAISDSASGEVAVQGGTITNSSLVAATYTASVGTEVEISGTQGYYIQPIFDSTNNKVVTIYSDADSSSPQYKGMAAVGTVSGSSISYGTPVEFNAGISYFIAGCFDSNAGKVVIMFRDQTDSEKTKAVVGTVSGTSISFGSEATITTNTLGEASIVFDSNENKVVAFYKDTAQSGNGFAAVGTVSGTSISFGTPVAFQSSQVGMMQDASCFDSSNNKVVIAYRDADSSGSAAAKVGTISGTSISFGSKTTIYSGQTENIVSCFDTTNNKVVVAYRENTAPKYLESAVGTVSGTSISFGTATQIASISASISDPAIEFSPDAGRVLLAYTDNDNSSHGTYAIGVVSGTSITYETPVAWCDSAPAERSGLCYDTYNNVFVISFEDGGVSGDKAKSAVITLSGSSALTIGSTYYVQDDGTLSTTSSSVTAGKALSATTLLLKG